MGQAETQFWEIQRNLLKVQGMGVLCQCSRLPCEPCVEQDRLVIFHTCFVKAVHLFVIGIKALFGGVKLQPRQVQFPERIFQFFPRILLIGVHGGKPIKHSLSQFHQDLHFLIGNPVAGHRGVIMGKKEAPVNSG